VLVRILSDNNDLHTQAGHIAVGWLVVEDLFTVAALVALPALLGKSTSATPLWIDLAMTGVKVTALVAFTAFVGTRVIPRALDHVAATRSRELFTLTVLVTALGIAVASSLIFNVSMALGAFLAGMIVGRSDYSFRAASEALPMRDAFAVLFFVSVGMLFDPGSLMADPRLTVGALGVVLVGKPLVAFVLVWAMKYRFRAALTVAVALAQIGEFSFMLATVGRDLGVLTTDATNALVAASITSIVLNPIAYRTIRPIERSLKARPRLWAILNREPASDLRSAVAPRTADASHRAVVIGYGPTGRTVVRLLRDNDIVPTVIELNIAAVRALKDEGVDAIYGDATRRETMEAAGVAQASTLILSSAGMTDSDEVIRMARGLNPDIRVLARAPYLRDLPVLKAAGADRVYSAEGEVALALIEDILDTLGATSEQIDRERARAHSELLGEG
jgi:CPA2 family monovalent cation:H+ antiporter-2